jgi:hypothetical protein
MARFARAELEQALATYNAARDRASATGDWNIWAELFTEDAHYIEHAYGELRGREAIRAWITGVMAPFPRMRFPQDWVVFDEERGAIVFQCQNAFPEPFDAEGRAFAFPNWTRIVYAGEGKFSSEEDIYNPARDAARTVKAWREAGGQFLTPERVRMRHR